MNVPMQKLWTSGDEPDADTFNEFIRDSINFLLDPPEVRLSASTSQTITGDAWTLITFQNIEVNNDNMAVLSGGSVDHFTCKTPGWYEIEFGTSYSSSADSSANRLTSGLRINSVTEEMGRRDSTQIPSQTVVQGGRFYAIYLNINDYIQLFSFHDGSNRSTVVVSNDTRPYLYAKWVSK